MAIAGEFVVQNSMMMLEVYSRTFESLPICQRMLLVTRHFACVPFPFISPIELWSTRPRDQKDSKLAKTCAKTGLLVPLHAQAHWRGKIYDYRWVPSGAPDDRR